MKADLFKIPLIVYLVYLFVGCNQIVAPNTMESPTHPPAETATIAETQTIPAMPTQHDDMPKDPPLPFPTNPGLQVLTERAKEDLAQRLSISASEIKVRETKEVFWPDASLGCSQPDIQYAQIPIPGYLIMLVHAGNEFEYHASIRGDTLYCENPTPPILGGPTDIDPFRIPPP
jgi:hypothetical protein